MSGVAIHTAEKQEDKVDNSTSKEEISQIIVPEAKILVPEALVPTASLHHRKTLAELDAESDKPDVDILGDINVPDRFYRRILTGIQIVDEMFGGAELPGILPGTSYLFTGVPGSGKSTVALQFADCFATHEKKSVLYNAGEESKWMIKMRADRLGIKGRFALSYFTDVEELIAYVEEYGVEILFVDSIQQLEYGKLSGRELLEKLVKLLHRYGHANNVTMFLIGQVTKAGVFSGPNAIKHDTDAHAHLDISKETGHRVFEMQKNRMGPAGIPYEFFMGTQGIDFKQLPPEEQEKREQMGRNHGRREGIKEFIKEKLLAGEYVSGYCFTRFDLDCSGGFFRGMIEKARADLQADGYKIGETRHRPNHVPEEKWSGNNRTHIFVIQEKVKLIEEDDEKNEE